MMPCSMFIPIQILHKRHHSQVFCRWSFLALQSKVELLADFQHVDFCGVAEELRKTNSVNGIVLEDKVIIYKT